VNEWIDIVLNPRVDLPHHPSVLFALKFERDPERYRLIRLFFEAI
jgi:hypothetical protein